MSVTIYPQFVPYEKPYSLREFNAARGAINGFASLDEGGKIPSSQLPSAIASGMSFVGLWNASTNTPNLLTATPRNGDYYRVSVSGATNLGGESDWKSSDWAVYLDSSNGWAKIDNSDQVSSVAGRTGAVTLNFTDLAGSATSAQLGASSVLNAALANDSVTSVKIADLSVSTAKVADSAVTTVKLADSAATAAKLAVNSVTETKVADSAITNAKLAGAITQDKLAGSIPYAKLSLADGDIPAAKLAGSIPYSKLSLSAGEVPADRIGVIPGSQLSSNSVTSAQIGTAAVSSDELASDSVISSKIAAEQVTAVKLSKRTSLVTLYPNFPNSSLRVDDPATSAIGFAYNKFPAGNSDANWCSYAFTTSSATIKSGIIGLQVNLPYNFSTLTKFVLGTQISGTGTPQVIVRYYDNTGDLKKTQTIAAGTGARVSTDIGLNGLDLSSLTAGTTIFIEIECRGTSADTVKVNSLAYEMILQ